MRCLRRFVSLFTTWGAGGRAASCRDHRCWSSVRASAIGGNELLSEIDAALLSSPSHPLVPELERQYELRHGPARRLRLARTLRLLAIGVLAALGLDLANGPAHLPAFVLIRVLIAGLCTAAAWMMARARWTWQEHLLYSLPLLCTVIGTEAMGEWAAPHYADRYMMAAAIVAIIGLAIPPVRVATGRMVALLTAPLFLLVLVLAPGNLPLAGNQDILAFAWGSLATASLIARLNAGRARTAFLHMLRHELMAMEMTLLNAELLRLSGTDALTGLPNRRAFDEEVRRLWADERVAGLGLALMDVDRFKAFNDTAGHEAGDGCLRAVAQLIAGALRTPHKAARYGGEEFAVLWASDGNDLSVTGERLRRAVAQAGLPHPGLGGAAVTISVGVSWRARTGASHDATSELVRAADAALYEAKEAGRNRVGLRMPPTRDPGGAVEEVRHRDPASGAGVFGASMPGRADRHDADDARPGPATLAGAQTCEGIGHPPGVADIGLDQRTRQRPRT